MRTANIRLPGAEVIFNGLPASAANCPKSFCSSTTDSVDCNTQRPEYSGLIQGPPITQPVLRLTPTSRSRRLASCKAWRNNSRHSAERNCGPPGDRCRSEAGGRVDEQDAAQALGAKLFQVASDAFLADVIVEPPPKGGGLGRGGRTKEIASQLIE